jgi:hypothetical protein
VVACRLSDGEHFLVQIYRDAIRAIGNSAANAEEFYIAFYQNRDDMVMDTVVEELVRDLRHAVEGSPRDKIVRTGIMALAPAHAL